MFGSKAKEIVTDEEQPKYVVTYLYEDEVGPNLAWRALSVDPDLADDFVFMSIENPSTHMKMDKGKPMKMPNLVGVMR